METIRSGIWCDCSVKNLLNWLAIYLCCFLLNLAFDHCTLYTKEIWREPHLDRCELVLLDLHLRLDINVALRLAQRVSPSRDVEFPPLKCYLQK